jgi:hypothetical protein
LLLYDKYLKAITVDADVIPGEIRVSYKGCEDSDYCFPFRNVMNGKTLHILETTIGVDVIRCRDLIFGITAVINLGGGICQLQNIVLR